MWSALIAARGRNALPARLGAARPLRTAPAVVLTAEEQAMYRRAHDASKALFQQYLALVGGRPALWVHGVVAGAGARPGR